VLDWWVTVRAGFSNTLQLVDITATSYDVDPGQQHTLACNGANCFGSNAGEPEPGNVTSTVSWRTQFIGRRFRGRNYLPSFVIGDTNNDDTIASATLVRLAVLAGSLLFSQDSPFVLAVFSRIANVVTPVSTAILENILDSMRRRLPGRGN